jgi:ABC-type amino acid transport substrate-binding protein
VGYHPSMRSGSWWRAAVWALLWAPPYAFAAPAAAPSPAEKSLRVLVLPDAKPEFFAADANAPHPGFEREILEGFARSQHVRLEIVSAKNWDELQAALRDGRGDLIAGHFTDTEERRRTIDFTTAVMPTQTVVVTRKPGPPVKTTKELVKRRVGAVKGGAAHHDMLNAGVPPGQVDDSPQQDEMLELLRSGKVNALARALPLAILNVREDPALEIGLYVGPRSQFAWGLRKGNTKLRDALNEHLGVVRSTGAWRRFVVKYFGEAAVDMLKQAESR